MKKIYILILVSFFTLSFCEAQTNVYHPFPDSNAVWRCGEFNINCGNPIEPLAYLCSTFPSYFIGHDTVINNLHYKIVQDSISYHGFVRQDTALRKVYAIPAGDSIEYLAYDDNWKVGDTLGKGCLNTRYTDAVISKVDSVFLYDSTYTKRIQADDGDGEWIQGVGITSNDFFEQIYFHFEGGTGLLCFRDAENCKYTPWPRHTRDLYMATCYLCGDITVGLINESGISEKYQIELQPNPATNQLTIRSTSFNPHEHVSVLITNIFGQAVYQSTITNQQSEIAISALPAGIYFTEVVGDRGRWVGKFIKQ